MLPLLPPVRGEVGPYGAERLGASPMCRACAMAHRLQPRSSRRGGASQGTTSGRPGCENETTSDLPLWIRPALAAPRRRQRANQDEDITHSGFCARGPAGEHIHRIERFEPITGDRRGIDRLLHEQSSRAGWRSGTEDPRHRSSQPPGRPIHPHGDRAGRESEGSWADAGQRHGAGWTCRGQVNPEVPGTKFTRSRPSRSSSRATGRTRARTSQNASFGRVRGSGIAVTAGSGVKSSPGLMNLSRSNRYCLS